MNRLFRKYLRVTDVLPDITEVAVNGCSNCKVDVLNFSNCNCNVFPLVLGCSRLSILTTTMYRPGEHSRGPPPFRPFPPGLPYNVRGPSTYPPNGPVPPGPYSVPPPDINFIHNIPRRDDFNRVRTHHGVSASLVV